MVTSSCCQNSCVRESHDGEDFVNTIPAVDAYIASQPEWAQPILEKFRKAAHKSSARLREEIKWGVPNFVCDGIVANMAGFKKHVTYGFWRAKDMTDPEGLFGEPKNGGLCTMKIASLDETPTQKILVSYFREALTLDDDNAAAKKRGEKAERRAKKPPVKVPKAYTTALSRNKKALAAFAELAPSHKREYIEWWVEAKRESTKERRLQQTIAWLLEGKTRNWKYQK